MLRCHCPAPPQAKELNQNVKIKPHINAKALFLKIKDVFP